MIAMLATRAVRTGRAVAGLAAACLVIAAAIAPVDAQQLTEQQLIEKLLGRPLRGTGPSPSQASPSQASPSQGVPEAQPSPRTRSMASPDAQRLRQLLDKVGTRAFSAKERTEVAEATRERPNIDFEVYFPFNSSALQPLALDTMRKIGQILTNPALADRGFLIAGHTDAKGRPEANLAVSRRRAESVKAYLVKTYGIAPGRLRVIGYGKEQLRDPAQPFSQINRRVQIINLPDGTLTASR